MERLNRTFFERAPEIVAKELLGHILVRKSKEGVIKGTIIETEAYGDINDLASHARFGITPRNKIMHELPGILYVYLNYGIFNLTNIICEKTGKAGAVLLRSAEIIEGLEIASSHIKSSKHVKVNEFLATGPGKLSIAFGIDRAFNGLDIVSSDQISIEIPKNTTGEFDIIEKPRIGIDYADKSKDLLWRFYIDGNQYISKK